MTVEVDAAIPERDPRCGTVAGYQVHHRRREKACDPCLYAKMLASRAWRVAHGEYGGPRTIQPCGTEAAYKRHWKKGEPPCDLCKEAHAMRIKGQREADRERARAYMREYDRKNPEKCLAKKRRHLWMKLYGLTPTDVAALFEASDGLCAFCYDRSAQGIDHNHETGEVRAALCHYCNTTLGRWGGQPDEFRRAADYLESTWVNYEA